MEQMESQVGKKEAKAIIKRACERLRRWDDVMGENAKDAVSDLKFALLGDQWSGDDLAAREGRPSLTVNKLAQYVNQVVNEARQAKQEIKVLGVDGKADRAVADIMTGLIRNIEYNSRADVATETAYEHAIAGGMGYFGVITCYAGEDTFDQDIKFRTFENFLAVKLDCDSTMPDGSDSDWGFVEDKMVKDEFEAEYGRYKGGDTLPDSYADYWHDDDSVYIREYWERTREPIKLTLWSDGVTRKEGEEVPPGLIVERERTAFEHKVKMYKICGDRVLSAYDFPASYIPIFPVYGKRINVQGKLHIMGLVRFARDPQKMFNYWRSATAEKIALAPRTPIIASAKMVEGYENIYNSLNTTAYPWVPYNPDPSAPGGMPMRLSTEAEVGSMMMANQSAEADIRASVGIPDPVLGSASPSQSGRAILALQRQGDTSTFNYADNLARAKAQAGRVIVQLIGKLYDTPRIVRVLGEDGNADLVQINQVVPGAAGVMQVLNDVTLGKYDVEVTTGPSYATKRMEASQGMLDFMQAFPAAGPVLASPLAKLQDWPGSEELSEKLAALAPGAPNPQAMAMQVAEQAKAAMGAMEQQFTARLKEAEDKQALEWAKLKLEAQKIKVDADKVETDRLTALNKVSPVITPEAVAPIVQNLLADMGIEAQVALDEELADAAFPDADMVAGIEVPESVEADLPGEGIEPENDGMIPD